MDSENFKYTLFNQYREEIRNAYMKTEHNGLFDATEFTNLLHPLWKAAQIDGLEEQEFESLITDVLSNNEIHFPANTKAA